MPVGREQFEAADMHTGQDRDGYALVDRPHILWREVQAEIECSVGKGKLRLKAIELVWYVLDVGKSFGVQKLTCYVLRSDANTRRLVDADRGYFGRLLRCQGARAREQSGSAGQGERSQKASSCRLHGHRTLPAAGVSNLQFALELLDEPPVRVVGYGRRRAAGDACGADQDERSQKATPGLVSSHWDPASFQLRRARLAG